MFTIPIVCEPFFSGPDWNANRGDYRLPRSHLHEPAKQPGRDWWFLVATEAILFLSFALPIAFLIYSLRRHT